MKPASIFTLLNVLAEISEAEQLNADQVKSEIDKANSIEDLAEALGKITQAKTQCCKERTSDVRISDSSLSFPSLKDGMISVVIGQIEAVQIGKTNILIHTHGHTFPFSVKPSDGDYIDVNPAVFAELTRYFTA